MTAEQPADHLAVALRKLATHIGEPKKFHKASELLLQLLHQHCAALDKSYAPLLFEVSCRAHSWSCMFHICTPTPRFSCRH